jgi:hypothetical protein
VNTFLAVLTYFAYCFIIGAYTVKIVKYLRLPTHLRWELYPVIHENAYHYGGSRFENREWWLSPRPRRLFRALKYLLKDYLYFETYLKKDMTYWFFLYLSHVGFILLMFFQGVTILGAILSLNGIQVDRLSPFLSGWLVYILMQSSGFISFLTGMAGNLGLFILRRTRLDLRTYATPLMYFGYWFHILLSFAGFFAWFYEGYDFSWYRKFWEGLFTLEFTSLTHWSAFFVFLMALHLIYLPFTRAIHYITRLFAFFLIRWDDEPNIKGSELERRLTEQLNYRINWSAPHIITGKKWKDQVQGVDRS